MIIYLLITSDESNRLYFAKDAPETEEIDILDKHGTQRENLGEARYAKLSSKLPSNSVSGS